jgi:hypothetical protein
MNFGVNLGGVSAAQLETVRSLIAEGHECCDHTPNHATSLFSVSNPEVAQTYVGQPGVDHVHDNIVCLKYGAVNLEAYTGETTVSIQRNIVLSTDPGAFSKTTYTYNFIDFPTLGKMCRPTTIYNRNRADPDTMIVTSFWGEPVNFGDQESVPFHLISTFDGGVESAPDALRQLVARSVELQRQYDLPPFQTWLHPGGAWCQAQPQDLYGILSEAGYTAAGTERSAIPHVYNEPNANGYAPFGMHWSDFYDESDTLPEMKAAIANGIAQHRAVVGGGHFRLSGVTWDGYIARLDSLLAWCSDHQIPVATYPEMAEWLYNTRANPNVNIFPDLTTDFDDNGVPDGLSLGHSSVVSMIGPGNVEVPCVMAVGNGNIFGVGQLYGIEKGDNLFTFSAKSEISHRLRVVITKRTGNGHVLGSVSFGFNLNSDWQFCSASFTIQDSVNQIQIAFVSDNAPTARTWLTGFCLRGNTCPDNANLLWPPADCTVMTDSLSLHWEAGAIPGTGYELSLTRDDGTVLIDHLDVGTAVSWDISSYLELARLYNWQVTAYTDREGQRVYAAGQNSHSFTVANHVMYPPLPPTCLNATIEVDSLYLTWNPVQFDTQGNPIQIASYRVRNSDTDRPTDAGSVIAVTQEPCLVLPLSSLPTRGFFRVTAEAAQVMIRSATCKQDRLLK